jgi:hypothetical protein
VPDRAAHPVLRRCAAFVRLSPSRMPHRLEVIRSSRSHRDQTRC